MPMRRFVCQLCGPFMRNTDEPYPPCNLSCGGTTAHYETDTNGNRISEVRSHRPSHLLPMSGSTPTLQPRL
jgi:hypothetical protein